MNYPSPVNPPEVVALRQKSVVNEELIASAIVGVVQAARSKGQSLAELTAEILADDALLDAQQRYWLSQVIVAAWEEVPSEV